ILAASLVAGCGAGEEEESDTGGTSKPTSPNQTPDQPKSNPTLSLSAIAVSEGNGAENLVPVEIRLSGASEQDITFDYEFVSGTALAGEDFVSSRGSATIAAGERNHQLSLMVNPDARYEADETLEVVLSNLNNAQTTGLRGNRAVITLQ